MQQGYSLSPSHYKALVMLDFEPIAYKLVWQKKNSFGNTFQLAYSLKLTISFSLNFAPIIFLEKKIC